MSDTDKVYAVCENKCLKETMTKEQIEAQIGNIATLLDEINGEVV